MRFAAEHDVPARPAARASGRALRSPPSHATTLSALTAHTEPNSITCRRVVAAGDPTARHHALHRRGRPQRPNGRPAHSRLPNGRQPRCEVVVATTATEQTIRVAAGRDGCRLAHITENSVSLGCISIYEVEYSLTRSPTFRRSPYSLFHRSGRKSDRRFRAAGFCVARPCGRTQINQIRAT
jgi:hypothetical protein